MSNRFLASSVCAVALAGCLVEGADSGLGLDGGVPDAGTARFDANETPRPEDLDGYVQWEMERHGIAGLAAMIIRDDAPVWTGTFGMADIDAGLPVTEDTLFAVASISKTVVAVRAMQLVEQGLLDLDAPVDDYLPYSVRHPEFPDVPITTRMLLTHTAGLEDDFVLLAMAMDPGMAPVTLAEFSEAYVTPGGALYSERNWGAAPGTAHSYCNAAFGVIGHVLELAGGEPLPDQTKHGVRDPLGMIASGWVGPELAPSELAVGYTWNGREHTALEYEVLGYYPAGGLATSLFELSRFLRAFMQLGTLDDVRILSVSFAQAMREPQVPDIWDRQALAWRYEVLNGEVWLGHSGSTLGGSAQMLFRPSDNTGVILLANTDAYVLARLGITDGADALDRILDRLVLESTPL